MSARRADAFARSPQFVAAEICQPSRLSLSMLKPPTAEAISVLRSCVLSSHGLALPPKQLSKPLYAEVKRVLNALGGQWNTSAQAFLFDHDYQPRLEAVLDGREGLPDQNPTAFFPTQATLASSVIGQSRGLLSLPIGAHLLEPEAGRAALIDAVRAVRADLVVDACEIDPSHRAYLAGRGIRLVGDDFLSLDTSIRYDAIVMNPPFAVPGDKMAWLTHVEKALEILVPGGVLIAILPDGAMWRTTARHQALRARIEGLGGVFHSNSKDAFKESGTMTGTCTLFIDGTACAGTLTVQGGQIRHDDEDSERAQASARIATISPQVDHGSEIKGIEAAFAGTVFGSKHFVMPTVRRFSEIFASWSAWTPEHLSESRPESLVFVSCSCDSLLGSLLGTIRPEALAIVKESMFPDFGLYFELIEDADTGYTRVYAKYDRILGDRLIALVETRSLSFSALPVAVAA